MSSRLVHIFQHVFYLFSFLIFLYSKSRCGSSGRLAGTVSVLKQARAVTASCHLSTWARLTRQKWCEAVASFCKFTLDPFHVFLKKNFIIIIFLNTQGPNIFISIFHVNSVVLGFFLFCWGFFPPVVVCSVEAGTSRVLPLESYMKVLHSFCFFFSFPKGHYACLWTHFVPRLFALNGWCLSLPQCKHSLRR